MEAKPPKKKKQPAKKTQPVVKEQPVKKSKSKNSLVIVHDLEPEINENKYSEKLRSLLLKKKSQVANDPDVKIRFGWKY
jgi:hypothetical protein